MRRGVKNEMQKHPEAMGFYATIASCIRYVWNGIELVVYNHHSNSGEK